MGYVSFSENRISKLHVFEYILYLTLKGREPRLQDVSTNLETYVLLSSGHGFSPKDMCTTELRAWVLT